MDHLCAFQNGLYRLLISLFRVALPDHLEESIQRIVDVGALAVFLRGEFG